MSTGHVNHILAWVINILTFTPGFLVGFFISSLVKVNGRNSTCNCDIGLDIENNRFSEHHTDPLLRRRYTGGSY